MSSMPFAGLVLLAGLAATVPSPAPDLHQPCFDFRRRIVEPLAAPIPLVPGRDSHVYGTYPSGIARASGRVTLAMPIELAYAALLDHRNVKDMSKTTLATTVVDRPDYLAFHLVDVVVTLRALFLRIRVPWTEAWAYSLVEGTAAAPRR